jgi:glycosyltransferase involved in cell wall biosynthesis
MKILEIGSALHDWGGIERYLVYLCQALDERGHEIVCTVPPGSPLESKIAVKKVRINVRSQFQFSRIAAYLRLFREHRFDIVNAHFSPDFIVPAIASKLARQPVRILTRHVVLTWSPIKVRRYSRLFTHFIGVSDAVARKLIESGVSPDRVQVAKAGCPALVPTLPLEAIREQLAISKFACGFFGRVVDDKGVTTLVEAAQSLPPETFHVFGDGPLLAKLKPTTSVRFHGRVEDVANPMSAMDAVAIPSLWEEAFGFSAVEAMSLGKPIIATISGGLPELITQGENGFLIEKRDAKALAEAVEALRSDPALASRMGAVSRDLHAQEYTVARFGERMELAYKNAAGL